MILRVVVSKIDICVRWRSFIASLQVETDADRAGEIAGVEMIRIIMTKQKDTDPGIRGGDAD